MALARPLRALGLAAILLWCFFLYQIFRPSTPIKGPGHLYKNFERDPNLDRKCRTAPLPAIEGWLTIWSAATGEPEGILVRTSDKYKPNAEDSARINATLLALVRNEELDGMLQAMDDLERTWNHKFNYPWTFFNDVPFSEEFKKKTRARTKAECRYGKQAGKL